MGKKLFGPKSAYQSLHLDRNVKQTVGHVFARHMSNSPTVLSSISIREKNETTTKFAPSNAGRHGDSKQTIEIDKQAFPRSLRRLVIELRTFDRVECQMVEWSFHGDR